MLLKKSLVLIFILLALTLYSQDNDTIDLYKMSLQEILNIKVRVSSTEENKLFETPSTVTILDKNIISEYNFRDIAEAINTVSGIDVLQSVIDRNITTSRGILQNFYANKVLILINDVPTWQPITGNGFIERININEVERIEILKGPASVLYGSNAFTGVINIILTKPYNQQLISLHGSYGYSNLGEVGGNLNVQNGNKGLTLSFNSGQEERNEYNFEGTRGALYNNDSVFSYREKYENMNFTIQGNYKKHSLTYNHFYYGHSYLGAIPSYSSGAGNLVKNYGDFLNYKYTGRLTNKLLIKTYIAYDFFKREFPITIDKSLISKFSGDRKTGEIKLSYDHSNSFRFDLGTSLDARYSYGSDTWDGMKDTLVSHNLLNDKPIWEWSAFTQINYRYKWLNLLVGTRYTYNSSFGDNISSRISALFRLNNYNSIKLMYGEAFRAPSMLELYFNHPTVIGNSNLEPETSKSIELAYLSNINHLFFQALGYYASYDNLIQRITPMAGPPSQYQNVSHFEGYGAEIELRYHNPTILNWYLNYNYIKGVDEEKDENYKYVPDHYVSFGISKNIKKLSLALNGNYYSSVEGHLDNINPQFKLDFQCSYRHIIKDLNIKHNLIVKNITNSDMLIAEYIRQTPNINSIPTTAYGTRIIYSLYVDF